MSGNHHLSAALSFIAMASALCALPSLELAGPAIAVPGLAAAVVFVGVLVHAEREQRPALLELATLLMLQLAFWTGFARVGAIAAALGQAGGGGGSGSVVGLTLALALVAAPPLAGLWALLERRGYEPSHAAKLGLAHVGLALSCTCLATALEFSRAGAVLRGPWVAGVLALAFALAVLGPTCVRAVTQLVPKRLRVASLSSWWLSVIFAQSLGGRLELAETEQAMFDTCLTLGFVAIAIAVVSSLLWRSDTDDCATPSDPAAPAARPAVPLRDAQPRPISST